jgi:peroxiredoxin
MTMSLTLSSIILALAAQGGRPKDNAPKVGADAADFKLYRLDDKKQENPVKLSDFKGKKPVVLIFGSYT